MKENTKVWANYDEELKRYNFLKLDGTPYEFDRNNFPMSDNLRDRDVIFVEEFGIMYSCKEEDIEIATKYIKKIGLDVEFDK